MRSVSPTLTLTLTLTLPQPLTLTPPLPLPLTATPNQVLQERMEAGTSFGECVALAEERVSL